MYPKPQLCKTHFICAAFLVLHQNITHFVTPKEKRNILRGQYNYNFPLYVLWKSSIIIHSVLQSQYQIRVFYGSLICGKNINIHSCTLLSSRNKCTGLKFLKKKYQHCLLNVLMQVVPSIFFQKLIK